LFNKDKSLCESGTNPFH